MVSRIRKDIRDLSRDEMIDFTSALIELKRQGKYDKYVQWHHEAMTPSSLPSEPHDSLYRNLAHRGPAFLPWHRLFVLLLENELREVRPNLTIPYWDWTQDSDNPEAARVWQNDCFGGNGDPGNYHLVATGPFAVSNGQWPVPNYPEDGDNPTGLKRNFGNSASSLPTADDLARAMNRPIYDLPPYTSSNTNLGFRNYLEGWVTKDGDSQVTTPGTQLHNRVHNWVGGNMIRMTSPDDPVFFVHHCFIDKVWAQWQAKQALRAPDGEPYYWPERDGPPGHNFADMLTFGDNAPKKISELMSISALEYEYAPKQKVPDHQRSNPYL